MYMPNKIQTVALLLLFACFLSLNFGSSGDFSIGFVSNVYAESKPLPPKPQKVKSKQRIKTKAPAKKLSFKKKPKKKNALKNGKSRKNQSLRPTKAKEKTKQAERKSLRSKLERYQGPKPEYSVNPAHIPGRRGFGHAKTPLPKDAENVFKNAVPNHPKNPTAWFGKNSNGEIYRFSPSNDGTAHFSGIHKAGSGTRNFTNYAQDRLNGL